MAPRGYEMTSEQRNRIVTPNRFKCRTCQKFKGNDGFSNKELKSFQNKKALDPRINDISAQLRCRSCAGEQYNEKQCEGQCGLWKPLDEFSKVQRSRGEGWCKECVLWKEAAEPGVTTKAAPGCERAPDEIDDAGAVGAYWDPESGNGDSDEEENWFAVPYTQVDTAAYTETPVISSNAVATESVTSQAAVALPPNALPTTGPAARYIPPGHASQYVPPHLRAVTSSVTASTTSDYVPPHLRGTTSSTKSQSTIRKYSDVASQSSASNPYATSSTVGTANAVTGSAVEWSAVDARRRNGVANPSGDDLSARLARASIRGNSSRGRGTDDGAGGSWARRAGTRRTPAPQFPKPDPVYANKEYDTDGSDDVM